MAAEPMSPLAQRLAETLRLHRETHNCVEGSVRCGPDGDLLDLGPGDTAYFDGNVPHTYAGGPEGGRAMLVMSSRLESESSRPTDPTLYLSAPPIAACAAATRATGTRKGEQLT